MERDAQIAVFIDFENIALGVEALGRPASMTKVLERLSTMGHVVIKRAYGDFSRFPHYRDELMGNAIDCVQMFGLTNNEAKNAADIRIAVDIMEAVFLFPSLTHIAILSGDSDFTPVVKKAREHGKLVVGVGVRGSVSRYLTQACSEFIYYNTIDAVGEPTGVDLEEGRALLRRALDDYSLAYDAAPRAGDLKRTMVRIDPSFSEANYRFTRFTDFLRANDDICKLESRGRDLYVISIGGSDPDIAFTLDIARDLLIQTLLDLSRKEQKAPSGAQVKSLILQTYSDFDERRLGFNSFKAFLQGQKDIVEVSTGRNRRTYKVELRA